MPSSLNVILCLPKDSQYHNNVKNPLSPYSLVRVEKKNFSKYLSFVADTAMSHRVSLRCAIYFAVNVRHKANVEHYG